VDGAVDHREVVVVEGGGGRACEAMTAFDRQDANQRGFVAPEDSMAATLQGPERFDRGASMASRVSTTVGG
jgi:hypothetical protein